MMEQQVDLRSLEEVLRRIASAGKGEAVCIDDLLGALGQRSFGPLLLLPSLLVVSPISAIPGVTTLGAVMIALIAAQMLVGRKAFWLPQRLRRRLLSRRRLDDAVAFLSPAARLADKVIQPRLMLFTHSPFSQLIAATCILIALIMPPLEVLPLACRLTAAAVAAFALALVAQDGILAVLAFAVTAAGLFFGLVALF